MVVKSEYRHSFKPKFECFAKTYEGNVGYRLQQRLVEAGHQQDAFVWDESDWESDSENSCNGKAKPKDSNRTPRPASVPPHLYKHKKFNEAYQKRQESQRSFVIQQGLCQQTQDQRLDSDELEYVNIPVQPASPRDVREPVEEDDDAGHKDRQVQTPDWSRVRRKRHRKAHKRVGVSDHKEKASQTNGIEGHYRQVKGREGAAGAAPAPPPPAAAVAEKPTRPKPTGHKVPRSKTTLPKPRPMSAPLGRPAKKSPRSPDEDKPPFVPYGFNDKERETGIKKTHNVRASVDVYPSALRAQRRKKTDIEQREKDAQSAPYRDRRQKALFNDFDEKMKRETSQWDTEYRSHFTGHDKGLYQRAKCCRTPSAQGLIPGAKNSDYLRSTW